MNFENTIDYATRMDREDPVASYREKFYIPQFKGTDSLYFTGNSLGLQPKTTKAAIDKELEKWAKEGVEGHFSGDDQWYHSHKRSKQHLAAIVGAQQDEVILMNSLTVNLHLLMVSFYRPNAQRYKIIMEAGAFPSDQYTVESQVKFHGYDPDEAIIEVEPKEGSHLLETEDILKAIDENKDSVALVMLSGVQYFTGQFFDLGKITAAGHEAGAAVGFDLAHAAGNIPLHLHDWQVDFAVWCSYKYLNGGPGNLAGAFVHEKHGLDNSIPRFAGWWGHDEDERFLMKKGFKPMPGVDGWQLSNSNVIAAVAVNASLEIFSEVGMAELRKKSIKLTGYAEELINLLDSKNVAIITPANADERGCQLSIQLKSRGKEVFDYLQSNGVIADWREPNQENEQAGVIRIAPVPLYNSFMDIFNFVKILEEGLKMYNV